MKEIDKKKNSSLGFVRDRLLYHIDGEFDTGNKSELYRQVVKDMREVIGRSVSKKTIERAYTNQSSGSSSNWNPISKNYEIIVEYLTHPDIEAILPSELVKSPVEALIDTLHIPEKPSPDRTVVEGKFMSAIHIDRHRGYSLLSFEYDDFDNHEHKTRSYFYPNLSSIEKDGERKILNGRTRYQHGFLISVLRNLEDQLEVTARSIKKIKGKRSSFEVLIEIEHLGGLHTKLKPISSVMFGVEYFSTEQAKIVIESEKRISAPQEALLKNLLGNSRYIGSVKPINTQVERELAMMFDNYKSLTNDYEARREELLQELEPHIRSESLEYFARQRLRAEGYKEASVRAADEVDWKAEKILAMADSGDHALFYRLDGKLNQEIVGELHDYITSDDFDPNYQQEETGYSIFHKFILNPYLIGLDNEVDINIKPDEFYCSAIWQSKALRSIVDHPNFDPLVPYTPTEEEKVLYDDTDKPIYPSQLAEMSYNVELAQELRKLELDRAKELGVELEYEFKVPDRHYEDEFLEEEYEENPERAQLIKDHFLNSYDPN